MQRKIVNEPGFILCLMFLITLLIFNCGRYDDYKVFRVIDGDTFDVVDSSGTKTRIRLYGVDCPELPDRNGKQARSATDIMLSGPFRIEKKGKDRYGRTLAIVYLKGRKPPLNWQLVCMKLATISDRYCTDPVCDEWRKTVAENPFCNSN